MPKRFTDTEKWKKPFIRGLKAPYKLLWLYICDDCDHAGIWQVDIEVAQIRVGESLDEKTAIESFGDKIIPIEGGSKWYIPSFVEFQYPSGLSQNNKAHVGIIKILEKYQNEIDANKPLISPLQGAKDMDKDKDMVMGKEMDKDMVKEKVKVKSQKPKIDVILPWTDTAFIHHWDTWKTYKEDQFKFKYKSASTEQAALNDLAKISGGHLHIAIQIIMTSIKNGWKGLFELKNTDNGNTKTNQTRVSHITNEQLHEAFAKRFGSR
jgi:hypothetical protein